jgi:hypothetical protein
LKRLVVALLETLRRPVFAFVDFDPAGLAIAQSLPYFTNIISPPDSILQSALDACTNHDRYRSQLLQARTSLDAATHPTIIQHWKMLQRYGTALPQEHFLSKRMQDAD